MRSLTALSAFLDVSSLNLAVPQGTAFFLRGGKRPPSAQRPGWHTTFPVHSLPNLIPSHAGAAPATVAGALRGYPRLAVPDCVPPQGLRGVLRRIWLTPGRRTVMPPVAARPASHDPRSHSECDMRLIAQRI